MCPESFAGFRFDLGHLLQGQIWFFISIMAYICFVIGRRGFGKTTYRKSLVPQIFGEVRFDLGFLLQGRMWYLIPMIDCIFPIIGGRGFGCGKSCAPNLLVGSHLT